MVSTRPWRGGTGAGTRRGSADNASYFLGGFPDVRAQLFSMPGMTVPPGVDHPAGNASYATISTEELGRLDTADLVTLDTAGAQGRATFEALPGYAALWVVRNGEVRTPDDRQSAALSSSSLLSRPERLDATSADLANVVATTP